jgi:hypothetical protein
MNFTSSRPDVVRPSSQRSLLSYWDRLRGANAVPIWEGFNAEELATVAESLSFQDVVGTDGRARFLIRFHGKRIAEAYGDNRDVLKSPLKAPAFALCTTIQP